MPSASVSFHHAPPTPLERAPRDLSPAERKIKLWIKQNHGILSRISREFNCSVTFVQRIAYNREAKSAGMKIEQRLRGLGCPLIQKIQ